MNRYEQLASRLNLSGEQVAPLLHEIRTALQPTVLAVGMSPCDLDTAMLAEAKAGANRVLSLLTALEADQEKRKSNERKAKKEALSLWGQPSDPDNMK